jgi:hypothetical protein
VSVLGKVKYFDLLTSGIPSNVDLITGITFFVMSVYGLVAPGYEDYHRVALKTKQFLYLLTRFHSPDLPLHPPAEVFVLVPHRSFRTLADFEILRTVPTST